MARCHYFCGIDCRIVFLSLVADEGLAMRHFWWGFNIVFGSLFPAFTYWCIMLGMGYV